jgi:hypothetical protein
VTDLRLHKALYPGETVDQAVKVYASYATFELEEEPLHWRVRVTASAPERERRIAGELGNYALGLTVKARGSRPSKDVGGPR